MIDWITNDLLFVGIIISIFLFLTRDIWLSFQALSILLGGLLTYLLYYQYQNRINNLACNIESKFNKIPGRLAEFLQKTPNIGINLLEHIEVLEIDPYSLEDFTDALIGMEMAILKNDLPTARLHLAKATNSISGLVHSGNPIDYEKISDAQQVIRKTLEDYLIINIKKNPGKLSDIEDPRIPVGMSLNKQSQLSDIVGDLDISTESLL